MYIKLFQCTSTHVLPTFFRVPKTAFQAAINLHTVHLVARRAHILRARCAPRARPVRAPCAHLARTGRARPEKSNHLV